MKQLRYLCGLIVAASWVVSAVAGDVTYESLPELKAPTQKKPGVTYALLEKSHQTILGFTLLQNSFSEVAKRFGTSAPTPIADFTSGKAVCISSAQSGDPTKLLFVHIPVADLHGFVLLSKGSKIKTPAKCTPSTEVRKDLTTQGGIRLGMKRDEVIKAFGKPMRQTAGTLQYRFQIQKKFSPKEWFEEFRAQNKGADPKSLYTDVRTDVKAEFVNNSLVSYTVSTTDTY